MAISTSHDSDFAPLIFELAASLERPQRDAFEIAARAALAAAGCNGDGVGAAYRLLRDVQRRHWDPPPDDARAYGARHQRASKLADGPAIGADTATGRKSARSRWMRGWRG
jgi:hypothetical protein